MPQIEKDGSISFDPRELPRDYPAFVPDENNSLIRAKEPEVLISMTCSCGARFWLHVPYDPTNPLHELCDDCILSLPANPDQRYGKTTQVSCMDSGGNMEDDS